MTQKSREIPGVTAAIFKLRGSFHNFAKSQERYRVNIHVAGYPAATMFR